MLSAYYFYVYQPIPKIGVMSVVIIGIHAIIIGIHAMFSVPVSRAYSRRLNLISINFWVGEFLGTLTIEVD